MAKKPSDGRWPMTPYRLTALMTLIATLLFHLWQNLFAAHGGTIALPKSLWLGLSIFCWLLLPPMLIRHSRCRHARWVWQGFWLLMLARAAIEMWLLYSVNQWKYSYGIAHDIFSAAWLLGGWYACQQIWRNHNDLPQEQTNQWLQNKLPEVHHMAMMAAMFLCEAGFAYYISHFNSNRLHAGLWFIDWTLAHLPNLLLTCAVDLALLLWLLRLDAFFQTEPTWTR